ncbi:MAG: hypothetical protein PSY14_06245 [bacterium]|nr:hypothetical protein [bacterium]
MKHLILALALIIAFAAPSRAEDIAVARNSFVGDQEIALPELLGFQENYGKNPQFDTLVKQFVPPENRLLAVYLSFKDLKAMEENPANGIKKYMLVQTTKADVTIKGQQDFDIFKQAIIRETGGVLEADKAAQDMLNNINQGGGPQVSIGQSKSFGAFMNLDNAIGISMLANIGMKTPDGQQVDIPIAISMSALNVKNKAIIYSVYAQYTGPEDNEFVKETAKEYARLTLAANGSGVPATIADPAQDTSDEMNFLLNLSLVAALGIGLIIIGVALAPAIKKILSNRDPSV